MSESLTEYSDVPYVYDHVPRLRELMRTNGGLPGVTYAQICTSNAKAAQDDGWGPVERSKLYTITGPKGSADIILGCKGEPMRGASSNSGARVMVLDHDIYRLTGLWLGLMPDELQKEFNVNLYGEEVTPTGEVKAKPPSSGSTSGSVPGVPQSVDDKASALGAKE